MPDADLGRFYESALTAGAILTGFIGTFLNFRIQREADYFRSPGSDIRSQQHFTSSFLLIIVSAISSVVFGVVLPLFALVRGNLRAASPATILAGIIWSVVVAGAYFVDELFHYEIIFKPDHRGWRRESWIVVVGILLAVQLAAITYCFVKEPNQDFAMTLLDYIRVLRWPVVALTGIILYRDAFVTLGKLLVRAVRERKQ